MLGIYLRSWASIIIPQRRTTNVTQVSYTSHFKVCYSLYFTLYICFSFISFESLPFRNINSYGFTLLIHLKAFHYKFRTFYINFHKSYTSFQIENKKILFAKYYKYVKQMIDKINYNTILRTILSNYSISLT